MLRSLFARCSMSCTVLVVQSRPLERPGCLFVQPPHPHSPPQMKDTFLSSENLLLWMMKGRSCLRGWCRHDLQLTRISTSRMNHDLLYWTRHANSACESCKVEAIEFFLVEAHIKLPVLDWKESQLHRPPSASKQARNAPQK